MKKCDFHNQTKASRYTHLCLKIDLVKKKIPTHHGLILNKTSVFDLFEDTGVKNSQVESSWEWHVSAILDCTLHSGSVARVRLCDVKDSGSPWNHCRVKQPVHLPLPLCLKLSIDICTIEPTEVLCLTKHPPLYHMPVEILCKALGSWNLDFTVWSSEVLWSESRPRTVCFKLCTFC